MKTTGVLPEAFAASISRFSRSEIDAMPNSSRSETCSNQIWISPTMRSSSVPKQIAEKSMHRSQSRRPRGRELASLIGG